MNNEVKKIKRSPYNSEECVHVPAVDIYEDENGFTLKADMPGVTKENLNITLENNKLEIHGKSEDTEKDESTLKYSEFKMYDYHRSFILNDDINTNEIAANLENGVLTLTLPKSEEVKPKKIAINAAG
jgi:HSP20 family protein